MGENKQKVIIVLLIINAILVSYFGISLTKNLNAKNDMLVNQINGVSNWIVHFDNSISGRIQSALEARDNMIHMADYKYAKIDSINNKAALDLTVNLKAVNANSKIYLAYSEVDTSYVQEVELARKEGLSYGASVEMDLDKNYQYDVIERVDGGGEALLNINKQYIYLYDEFYSMRVQMHGSGSGRTNEQIDFDISFSVDDFGMDEFGLDKVLLEVIYKGKIIDTIDITSSIEYSDNSSLKEHYNIAVASGQIDPAMSMEEFGRTIGYTSEEKNDTRTYYTYTHSIHYDTDYPELVLDMNNTENMHVNLIITCKDGYQSEWK
jgi:hypothetical protein